MIYLLYLFIGITSINNSDFPNDVSLSCIKPTYFDQTKWILDSAGTSGYKYSIMRQISTDSSLIGKSKLYINCVFGPSSDIYKDKKGITCHSYRWFHRGYFCGIVFKYKKRKVVEVRSFKGCG